MNHCILFKIALIVAIINLSQVKSNAQSHLGIEGGATVSSLFSYQPTPYLGKGFGPLIGFRAGAFFEKEITSFLAVKTGLFFTKKGAYVNNPTVNLDVAYISVPILAVFTPVKPIKLGIGIETGILVGNNLPLVELGPLSFGVRSEIAWQISNKFRLIAHATMDLTPIMSMVFTDENGDPRPNNPINYQNISAGLSLAYTIKTFN